MRYELNHKFTLDCDRHNWILIEKMVSKTGKEYSRRRFFSTLHQLSLGLVEIKAKDVLLKVTPISLNKTSTAKPHNTLMENIIKELECFLKEIVKNEKHNKLDK